MANDKFINEIADKLQNHGSEVNPQMWQAVSSQIGAAGAGASGSAALGFGKVAAIVIGTTAVAVASYFAITSTSEDKTSPKTEVAQVEEQKTSVNQEPNANTEVKQTTIDANTIDAQPTEKITVEVEKKSAETQTIDNTQLPQKSIKRIEIPIITEPVRTISKSDTPPSNKNGGSVEGSIGVSTTSTTPDIVANDASTQKATPSTAFGITKLPNVFSPNNDGANDYFVVESKGLSGYSVVVLDKENNKVWQSIEPNAKWDGRDMSGQIVPAGDYIYFVAAEGPNGEKIGKYQRLTITK